MAAENPQPGQAQQQLRYPQELLPGAPLVRCMPSRTCPSGQVRQPIIKPDRSPDWPDPGMQSIQKLHLDA
jgi:hypothetical protein